VRQEAGGALDDGVDACADLLSQNSGLVFPSVEKERTEQKNCMVSVCIELEIKVEYIPLFQINAKQLHHFFYNKLNNYIIRSHNFNPTHSSPPTWSGVGLSTLHASTLTAYRAPPPSTRLASK
jgi:hypothetical protein